MTELFLKPSIQSLTLLNHRIVILCILPNSLPCGDIKNISDTMMHNSFIENSLLVSPKYFFVSPISIQHTRFCHSIELPTGFQGFSLGNNEKPYCFFSNGS